MRESDPRELVAELEVDPRACGVVDYRGPKLKTLAEEAGHDGVSLHRLLRELRDSNHRLWHLEDEARRTDAGDAHVAAIKRAIDRWNQRRSDVVERIDRVLLGLLPAGDPSHAGLSSETPGMMLDRLAILNLKIFHLGEIGKSSAAVGNADEVAARIAILGEQRADLCNCFFALIDDAVAGRRYFKLYRQLKGYNDPRFNPALSGAS